jgi:Xaa-Pro aminopeptidase
MRTVHPSIVIGSYVLDQDRVPRDEFQIRIGELNRLMDANGWKAVLVYGDAAEHSALAWFTGFTTRLRWGMALIPRAGEPRLLISMSSRDVPAMKLMTWIPDVLSGWNWESAFDPWLVRIDGDGPIGIGTVGVDLMRPPLFASLNKSLGNRFHLHAADEAVAAARTLRPRELSQIRAASGLVQTAAAAFLESWRNRKGVEAAALEAERTARLMAAQDVRTLVSFDGGRTLAPFRGAFEPQTDQQNGLVGYIAVQHMGYWAETFVTGLKNLSPVQERAQASLRVLLDLAKPGAAASALHAAAAKALAPYALHPVLSGSVGRRFGLSLNEGGEIKADSRHALAPGEVYALHVGACDPQAGGALTSAMIAITATGPEIIHLSPSSNTP